MAITVNLEVWHNEQLDDRGRPAGPMRGHHHGDRLTQVLVLDLAAPEGITAIEVAQAVFQASCHEAEDLHGWMVPIALRYRVRRLRALAVGDVVAIDGVGYAVDSHGWSKIPAPRHAA